MDSDSSTRVIQSTIGAQEEGLRLDAWLSERFSYLSRHRWQQEIRSGRITLNHRPTRCSRTLHAGDSVEFTPEHEEPPVDFDYRIVHEDTDLLVVDKGGCLPCHPAGAFFKNTLWHDLSQKYGKISIVNRLDRETSGLLIVARNSATAAILSTAFANNQVVKTYYALVFGKFETPLSGEGWLSNDPDSVIRKKRRFTVENPGGEAESTQTEFEPVNFADGISLVKVRPHTGRLHQIRATLCSLGFPLVGDKIYGPNEQYFLKFCDDTLTVEDWQILRMRRQALHATELHFQHPTDGRKMTFVAPAPNDFILR